MMISINLNACICTYFPFNLMKVMLRYNCPSIVELSADSAHLHWQRRPCQSWADRKSPATSVPNMDSTHQEILRGIWKHRCHCLFNHHTPASLRSAVPPALLSPLVTSPPRSQTRNRLPPPLTCLKINSLESSHSSMSLAWQVKIQNGFIATSHASSPLMPKALQMGLDLLFLFLIVNSLLNPTQKLAEKAN